MHESRYYELNREPLESCLSDAVAAAMSAQPEDPVTFIAQHLLVSRGGAESPQPTPQLELHVGSAAAKMKTSAAVRRASIKAGAATAPIGVDQQWTVAEFLGKRMAGPVAEALLRPIGGKVVEGHVALAFLRELGPDRAAVRALLDAAVLDGLADAVCAAASELSREAPSAEAMSAKFAETTFTLSFGGLDTFFSGLEGRLGPPSPDLRGAMERDHCEAADSTEPFRTGNYGMETTSETEWWYVVDPAQGLAKLARAEWPREQADKLKADRRRGGGEKGQPLPLSALLPRLQEKNAQLRRLNQPELLEEELIGGRLYTGPMFHKYNLVLRGAPSQSEREEKHAPPQFMRDAFAETCRGNLFATTLHVLNSCIVKLSKLTVVGKVYRGLAAGALPKEFWTPDEHNVRGGVESAFMSTTTSREVAASYAGEGGTATILELEQGMCSRGAELSWLSQYPHEQEVLFAPLTGIELHRTRVEGSAIVAEMKVTVNLTSPTIDQVLSKMKNAFLQVLTLVMQQLRREARAAQLAAVQGTATAAAAAAALPIEELVAPLTALQTTAQRITPGDFVVPTFFGCAVQCVLDTTDQVLGRLEEFKCLNQQPALRAAPPSDGARHALLSKSIAGMVKLAETKWRFRKVEAGESPLTAAKDILERALALVQNELEGDANLLAEQREHMLALKAEALQGRALTQLIFDYHNLNSRAIEQDLEEAHAIRHGKEGPAKTAERLNSFGLLEQKRGNLYCARQRLQESLVLRYALPRGEAAIVRDDEGEGAARCQALAQSLVSLGNLAIEGNERGGPAATAGPDGEGGLTLAFAIECLELAVIAYALGFGPEHAKMCWALEGLGGAHDKNGNDMAALEAFEKAAALRRKQVDAATASGHQGFSKELAKTEERVATVRARLAAAPATPAAQPSRGALTEGGFVPDPATASVDELDRLLAIKMPFLGPR